MIQRRNFIQNALVYLAAVLARPTMEISDNPQFAAYFSRTGSTMGEGVREALIVSHENQIEVRFKFNDRLVRTFPNGEWEENGIRHPRFPYSDEHNPFTTKTT